MKASKTLRVPNQEDAFSEQEKVKIRICQQVGVRAAIENTYVDASIIQRRCAVYREIHKKKQGRLLCNLRFLTMVSRKPSSIKSRKGGTIGVYKINDMKAAMDFLKENELNTGRQ